MNLTVSSHSKTVTLVEVEGELDLYNATELKKALSRAFAAEQTVILDLGDVDYIDSSGIGVLLYSVTESRKRDVRFCIVGVSGQVERIIELTSLIGILPIYESRSQALLESNAAGGP